jgi:hypothetical protein
MNLGAPCLDFQTWETSKLDQPATGTAPFRDIDTAQTLRHTLPMNITFSVEDQVAERARQSAAEMGETLEQTLEDYVRTLAEKPKRVGVPPGRRTLREEIYRL